MISILSTPIARAQHQKQPFNKLITAKRVNKIDILIALIILSTVALSSCGIVPAISAGATMPTPISTQAISNPEQARQAGLDYLVSYYDQPPSITEMIWVGGRMPSEEIDDKRVFQYVAEQWSARVTFSASPPEDTIFSVVIQSEDITWEGLVDAQGQIATTSTSFDAETADSGASDLPGIKTYSYQDNNYRISLTYPSDWSFTESTAGSGTNAKAVKLQKDDWVLVISYKLKWDTTPLGGELPAGDVVERGQTTLLGRSIPKKFVVYDGKDKVLFYGDRFEDLEVYVRLDAVAGEAAAGSNSDYFSVDIPDNITSEVENITASITRTGSPIASPTPMPTPLPPTPTPIPPTPTPIPVPCNAISFQSDITIEDGTIFAPGADFTKTWRLKNIGSCSWTTNYDLVFVDGDQMSGAKAIALPEKIRPGEALEISVSLTSPSKAGEYRGYWMLRSNDGEWFGYGNAANQAFWVDIEVIEPAGNHKYDFGLNLCAAIWRSEALRLPCPGYTTSQEGFSQVLNKPKLENRNENELAIWVHPNEQKYGWLEGTYPSIEIQEGDHFKAWVGCLQGYDKCSLKFYLDYQNEDGKVYRLGEWVEEYDGEITIIDLDLSNLAGQTIRPILGVEAITKNAADAHGFWFVPVISHQD